MAYIRLEGKNNLQPAKINDCNSKTNCTEKTDHGCSVVASGVAVYVVVASSVSANNVSDKGITS